MSASQTKPRLHYGNPDPKLLYNTTFCGRWLEDVDYWATPDVGAQMTFTKVCAVCAQSLKRRKRDFIAEVGRA